MPQGVELQRGWLLRRYHTGPNAHPGLAPAPAQPILRAAVPETAGFVFRGNRIIRHDALRSGASALFRKAPAANTSLNSRALTLDSSAPWRICRSALASTTGP